MCDTCESNEIVISILTTRLLWIEELLSHMTRGESVKFLNVSNDINKAEKHNFFPESVRVMEEEKVTITERIEDLFEEKKKDEDTDDV